MKATEQYFPVVLFIMLYKVVLTFESVDETVTIQMKATCTEQYFPVVLFITLCKVVLTFESVDEILKCDLKCGAVFHYTRWLSFFSLWMKSTIQIKATEQNFPALVLFINKLCYKN